MSLPDDETTMPENEPLTEEMKARVLSIFKPPFAYSMGYVLDSGGRMVADDRIEEQLGMLRMRGWGRLTGKGGGMGLSEDDAYEIQCAAGQMFAEAFNAYWNPTAGQAAPCVPLERVEDVMDRIQRKIAEIQDTPGAERWSPWNEGKLSGLQYSLDILAEATR